VPLFQAVARARVKADSIFPCRQPSSVASESVLVDIAASHHIDNVVGAGTAGGAASHLAGDAGCFF